jgi:hypothetical protein
MAKAFGGAALAAATVASSEHNTITPIDDRERSQIPIFSVESADDDIVNNLTTTQNEDVIIV